MKKAAPILVILIGLGTYVYLFHIQPARQFDPTVKGFGTVEAEEIVISPRIAARITSIDVEDGSGVTAGQVLVTLSCDDIEARLNQARAQVRAAEAAVAQAGATKQQAAAASKQAAASVTPYLVNKKRAERELARALILSEQNTIPKKAVDDAQSELEALKERIAAAEQGVNVSQRNVKVAAQGIEMAEAQVALARASADVVATALADCRLLAPRAGVVAHSNYHVGELVLPGANILKIYDLNDVFTWIYVPNEEVGRVHLNQRVRVIADTYPGRQFEGKVVRISEEAEFTPKSIQTKEDRTQLVYGVKVILLNSDRALLPGMPVEASLVENGVAAAVTNSGETR